MIQEAQYQLGFVEKTSFVLASNKSSNNSNKVVGIMNFKVEIRMKVMLGLISTL
jgi:hypothetical protein